MATFKYRALGQDGNENKGVIQAVDEMAAVAKIRENYPIIVSVDRVKEKGSSIFTADIGGNKLNIKNLSIMCSQLAITLKAGMPLARSLEMIGGQTEDKLLKKMLLTTAEDVAAGASISDTMERNCKQLPVTFLETIRAGEESGNIERSFEDMAKYYDDQAKLKGKVKSALAYPIFVLVIGIIVLVIVMVLVVPSLIQTFAELGGELPFITVMLIAISDFFRRWWIVMAVVALAIGLGLHMFHKTEKGKEIHAKFQLSLPALGKIHLMNGAAQFANTMSMLLKSGLTVDRAIDITSRTLDNYIQAKEVDAITAKIQEGRSLGECMRRCQSFPNTLKEMCAIGEESGELDNTLEIIGEFYNNEAEEATKSALAKLEPTMLVVMGIFAGFIVIAIYLPMFTMYNYM